MSAYAFAHGPNYESAPLEDLIGDGLKSLWSSIAAEPLPASLEREIARCSPGQARALSSCLPQWWIDRLRMREWRAQEKLMERAVRKQGVAWLCDDEYGA